MRERAETEYQAWCREHRMDPQDTASMTAYEEQYDAEWVADESKFRV